MTCADGRDVRDRWTCAAALAAHSANAIAIAPIEEKKGSEKEIVVARDERERAAMSERCVSALIMSDDKNTWGGKREGAGRPKTGFCKDAPHRRRPELSSKHPVHVVLRILQRVTLRRREIYHALRSVLARYLGRADFHVVHVSIQDSHVHLLVEASNRRALTRGMQSFAINAARAFHQVDGGCGKVFAYRYHATQIQTRYHARHALAYVLNNWRRHRLDWENGRQLERKLDPYSSAIHFTNWTERFAVPRGYEPLPVSAPETPLLCRKYKPLDPWHVPGPLAFSW
jgi:putative transposase